MINNKIYIGQTNNPPLRWSQHKSNAKYNRGNQVITRAIIKYSSENFKFEVIATSLTQEDVDFLEEQIISQYNSRNPLYGYNVDPGGNTTPKTPEILQKISDGLKKYYKTHNNWNKGGVLSDEWKENLSKGSMGKLGTNLGKSFSNDWKIKISKAQSGKERKSTRRFTEEIEKEICRLYVEEAKSTYKLEQQYNCCRTLIKSILLRNDVEIRKSNYTGHNNGCNIFSIAQELEICAKYLEGNISRHDLSTQFNCGKTTIREILLRHNVKL
jgi:group I intron endonuclease